MSNTQVAGAVVALVLLAVIVVGLVVAGVWWKHRQDRPSPASLMSDPTDDDWPF